MADHEGIEPQVALILDGLKTKEDKFEKVGFAFGLTVFLALLGVVIWKSIGNLPESWESWAALVVFGLGVPLAIASGVGAGIFWLACLPAERKARHAYADSFASGDARNEADNVLLRITETERPLRSLPRFRAKLGVVISRFRCNKCGSRLRIEGEGRVGKCRKCNLDLALPRSPSCPRCGSSNTRLLSPQEQVAPIQTGQGKTAGALMYGPAGILAGGLLDAIYKPFKEGFRELRVASKRYLFKCDDCYKHWAYKLPLPGDR